MAFQMVYTSVKSGLVAGRSGFCTAARHREIKESLVSRIESFSNQYDRSTAGTGPASGLPVIYSHRIVTIRSCVYHVLTRVADAGNDYSGRTNHIAHSIVVEPDELKELHITPAEAILELCRKRIWRERYDEAAQFFGPDKTIDLRELQPILSLPALEWRKKTGHAGNAACLVNPKADSGAGVILPDSYDPETLLRLFGESALLAAPDRNSPGKLWSHSFSTLIQTSEQRTGVDWYGSVYNSRVHMALLRGNRYLVEIDPNLPAPSGPLAAVAEGKPDLDSVEPEKTEASTLNQPAATTISVPEATPIGDSPLKPEVLEGKTSSTVGTTATRITRTPSVGEPVPANLCESGDTRSKSGMGLIFAAALLALVAVGITSLFHFSPVRVAEREISTLLSDGNWEAAANHLEAYPAPEKAGFIDKSASFARYAKLLNQFETVESELQKAAFHTETFLEKQNQLAPGKAPLRHLAEVKDSWERSLRLHPEELPVPDHFGKLQQQAIAKIQGYIREEKEVSKSWSELMALKTPAVSVSELRQRVFALDTESDSLLSQIKCIEDVTPFVREYRTQSEIVHLNVADALDASAKFEQLSTKLGIIQAKAGGKEWEKYIASIRKQIATFEPRIKTGRSATNLPAIEFAPSRGNVHPPEKTTTTFPPVPETGMLAFSEDSDEISYDHIAHLADGLPEALAIIATESYFDKPLERKKELAKINGETVMYFFTGEDTVKIFSVDEPGKVIRITPDFRRIFQKGFQLSLGEAGDAPPEVVLFGQRPEKNAPSFFYMSSKDGLHAERGEDLEISLSKSSLELLSQIQLPEGETSYELFLSDASVPVAISSEGPELLKISPSKRLDQRIQDLENQVRNYSALQHISGKFEDAFGNLGSRLFSTRDGKVKTSGLKIKSFPNKGNPPHFGLVPDEDNVETLATNIQGSLGSYIEKSGDFIEGPPFLHYISAHLGENLQDYGMASSRSMPQPARDTIQDAFRKIRATEQWGKDEVKEAIRLLDVISATAQNFNLNTTSITGERFPNQELAERARKRREKDYRQDQIVAHFFTNWLEVFTGENLGIAEKMILAGGTGGFEEAKLDEIKTTLKQVRAERSAVSRTPLSELGAFRVEAQVKSDNGSRRSFNLLQLSENEAPSLNAP